MLVRDQEAGRDQMRAPVLVCAHSYVNRVGTNDLIPCDIETFNVSSCCELAMQGSLSVLAHDGTGASPRGLTV
jgi:hypothetical protein